MKIGIIGAGKVGVTLGKYLAGISRKAAGQEFSVAGFYSRSWESIQTAADFTKTKAFEQMDALVKASDTLFITTPDGVIAQIWDCIAKDRLAGKMICHFSGSLSSHVFSGIEETGAAGCSIHPMYAFSDKFTSYQQFHTAELTMEGGSQALQVMKPFFEGLGHTVHIIDSADKIKYHAAAVFASNYVAGLFQVSLGLLGDCGFTQEDALKLLRPLAIGNVNALTGPIERGDAETVQKHLNVLAEENIRQIYSSIGRELLAVARQKNPDRDYGALEQIL